MQTCPYDGRALVQPHLHGGVLVMPQPTQYIVGERGPETFVPARPRRRGQPPTHRQDVRDPRAMELAVWAFAAAYPMYVIHG